MSEYLDEQERRIVQLIKEANLEHERRLKPLIDRLSYLRSIRAPAALIVAADDLEKYQRAMEGNSGTEAPIQSLDNKKGVAMTQYAIKVRKADGTEGYLVNELGVRGGLLTPDIEQAHWFDETEARDQMWAYVSENDGDTARVEVIA